MKETFSFGDPDLSGEVVSVSLFWRLLQNLLSLSPSQSQYFS